VVFGTAPSFMVAVVGRLLIGVGASVVLIAFLGLAAEWFRAGDFATIAGLTQTVGNIGGLAAAAPLALLVDAIGWRGSFAIVGAVTTALAILVVLGVRDHPPGHDARVERSLGAVITGIPAIMMNRRTWPPLLAASAIYSAVVVVQGLWGIPYLTQVYGLARVQAATDVALLAMGVIVGAPLVGTISDRWIVARRPPFVTFGAIFAACWLPLVVPALQPPPALIPPLFFLLGFSSSALILVWPCVREVNDPSRIGVIVGFCNIPIFLFLAVMQWMSGVILDATGTGVISGTVRIYPAEAYRAAFGLCLALALGAVACAALVTETRCRNVWSAR